MRFAFSELPGDVTPLPRPLMLVQLEDLGDLPQLCLVDTGAIGNRLARWLADAAGIDLAGVPESRLLIAGVSVAAWHARADLTIAGVRYDAPISFCEPWPFPFGLLGQEGFLRYFRVELSAAEGWLDVTPEV